MTTNLFSPLSFVAVFGSGIRDPGSEIRDPGSEMGKNQDPGSGINVPDPQHWFSREATATRGAWNAMLTGGFNHRFLNYHFTL
jgi:hypothetical protein